MGREPVPREGPGLGHSQASALFLSLIDKQDGRAGSPPLPAFHTFPLNLAGGTWRGAGSRLGRRVEPAQAAEVGGLHGGDSALTVYGGRVGAPAEACGEEGVGGGELTSGAEVLLERLAQS